MELRHTFNPVKENEERVGRETTQNKKRANA